MGISEEYLSVEMTIEQAAAMRAILKLEYIYTLGRWLNQSKEMDPIAQLQSSVFFTDRWANLDRPFGVAMMNRVLADGSLKLTSELTIRMGKVEKEMLSDLLFTGHFITTLDAAKDEAGLLISSFVSVVLIDRNLSALKSIFLPGKKEDHQGEGPTHFWFEQVSPKGVIN
jgi:hypothetical protein